MANPSDPARIGPMLQALEKVWRDNPDLRLGELITECVGQQRNLGPNPLFFVEDAEVFEAMKRFVYDDSKLR